MTMEMVCDYKNDDGLRLSFNKLAGKVFGIDFERWYRLGFWNDRYICYSFAEDGEIVSNVSASRLDIIIEGKKINAVQIGTVMTHPDYRGKGLAGKLMDKVLEEYEGKSDLVFLFGNLGAAGFYSRFGFDTARETQFFAGAGDLKSLGGPAGDRRNMVNDYRSMASGCCGIRKLDISDPADIEIIRRLTADRAPLSRRFGIDNAGFILSWYFFNILKNDAYYLDALDTIVLYGLEGDVFNLYDVVCTGEPDMKKIIRCIAPGSVGEAVLHFTPENRYDWIKTRPYETGDYIFFVKSEKYSLTGEFFYPYTAHA